MIHQVYLYINIYITDTISVIDDPTLLCQIEIGEWISDIEYLDNGQLVVCVSDGLQIYDDNGDEIDHYLSRNCKPVDDVELSFGGLCGVSVGRNVGNFVVTDDSDPGYLHVYDTAGDSWRYNRCRVCQGPSRVGVTSDGCYIVSSYVNNKLYKYTSRGVELWSIDTSRDGEVSDVYVDDDDKIFVCLNNIVVVYDKNGKQISSLQSTDREMEPTSVCVDKNKQIFVCDQKNNNILLFDRNYCFVKCLLHLDYIPWKICLFKNERLSVSGCYYNDNVYVYKI